jgi:hypothetical protein
MRAGYCMCVDPKLKDREIVCSLRTYTKLRDAFIGCDYRVRLNEDVEEDTVILSRDLYATMYQDMLDILAVKETALEGAEAEQECPLDLSDSELLSFSDSCL